MNELNNKNFFDYKNSVAKQLFNNSEYPWEVLPLIEEFIATFKLSSAYSEDYVICEKNIYIHKTAEVAQTAYIGANTIIGPGTELRHGAYIRGNAIIGEGCVIGNSTEIKNAILFNFVQVPHYNYIGDSILGNYAHLGAGAVSSNVKSDKTLIKIKYKNEIINTNLKKLGAIIAGNVEVGCNSVLNPGTIIGEHSNIYPLSSVRGYIPSHSIYKSAGIIVGKTER